ncbi:transposase [Corynebacterium flavescens]|uniref:transposase n=1 Tax=Corynebacterium flavescens TaxID=28028 RepID=UPI003FCF073C
MGAKRKRYTPAYRRDAAHLVIDTGRTIVEVAREIGVGEALLGRWVAAERARMDEPPGRRAGPERAGRGGAVTSRERPAAHGPGGCCCKVGAVGRAT